MKLAAMRLPGLVISYIEVSASGSLRDLVWDMARLAKELNCVVKGKYNGVDLTCNPGDSHNLLITHYRQFMPKGVRGG